jgi:DNA-binding NtrC family response regulator
MAKAGKVTVLTYNGIDGACAAAMALLRHPKADVLVSSAAGIGRTLDSLAGQPSLPAEVHVCGVGIRCDWDEVARALRLLKKKGTAVTWYCGRGYLDDLREDLAAVCTPVFLEAPTNTAAVCEHLDLADCPNAEPLLRLALTDPNTAGPAREPQGEQAFWTDLINAAIAQYFKYQDTEAYPAVVRKLAAQEYDEADAKEVSVFRRSGFAHVLWGRRTAMGLLRDRIRRCAETDESVLIVGESGTGKEYAAHLIHERSQRAMGPFIPVNCALFAGNPALANSTLFGHVKGAFTGAVKDRDGAFVTADSGILFLDEVGELPGEVQAKFLRVLEDGWVTPEGSDEPRKVDVRVVAATNRSLPEMIRAGEFRADLYHRLDTLLVEVPPLREHIEDIGTIVRQLFPALSPDGRELKLSAEDLEALKDYDWPGNVRQLIKVLKRSLCLGLPVGKVLDEERRLGPLVEGVGDGGGEARLWPVTAEDVRPIREVRAEYAARALELHGGNLAATARALGIAVNTLRSYLPG